MKEFLWACKSVVSPWCRHKAQLNLKLVANPQENKWEDLNFLTGFTI